MSVDKEKGEPGCGRGEMKRRDVRVLWGVKTLQNSPGIKENEGV